MPFLDLCITKTTDPDLFQLSAREKNKELRFFMILMLIICQLSDSLRSLEWIIIIVRQLPSDFFYRVIGISG